MNGNNFLDGKTCIDKDGNVIVWMNVGNKTIPVQECHGKHDELYHNTSFSKFKTIVDSGYLIPNIEKSNAVSFSANFHFTYTASQIKIVFYKNSIQYHVYPMRYHVKNFIIPDEKCKSTRFYHDEEYDADAKLIRNEIIQQYGRDNDRSRAAIRIQRGGFEHECEWLSNEPVPVDSETVKSIYYIIPIVITKGWEYGNSTCNHHGIITIDENATIDDLLSNIAEVRTFCKENELHFAGVYTDYRAIVIDEKNGIYLDLNEENLRKIALGRHEIIYSHAGKGKLNASDFPCKNNE